MKPYMHLVTDDVAIPLPEGCSSMSLEGATGFGTEISEEDDEILRSCAQRQPVRFHGFDDGFERTLDSVSVEIKRGKVVVVIVKFAEPIKV